MIFRGHRVKNEKKTISNWGWRCKGTAIFQTVSPAFCKPLHSPMPNGHSLFFPECPRKHPVYARVPPSDRYQIHPQQPWNENKGSCDPAVWGHIYEKLSHPLETIIGTEKETADESLDSVRTDFPKKTFSGHNYITLKVALKIKL